jgi:putative aldouronate transport system substrate-binding protein
MSVQYRRRRQAAVAGLSLLALVLAACSGQGSGDDAQGKPLPTITGNPDVTLNVFAPQAADQNLATSDFTKLVKQKPPRTTAAPPRRSGRSRWPAATIPTCTC